MLASVNAMETTAGQPVVPDSYYLLDVNGNKIQNWPGTPGNFLLNMTNPAVVQFMAQYSYQQMTQTGFQYSGVFFDNVEMMISNMTTDCYGNPIQINDNYPGPPDPTGVLDEKWSAGMFNLLAAFKQLAPGALISVHANQLPRTHAPSRSRTAMRWYSTPRIYAKASWLSEIFGTRISSGSARASSL